MRDAHACRITNILYFLCIRLFWFLFFFFFFLKIPCYMRQYNQIIPTFYFNGCEYSVKNVSTCTAHETCYTCIESCRLCMHTQCTHAVERELNAIFNAEKIENSASANESEQQGNLACVIFINFYFGSLSCKQVIRAFGSYASESEQVLEVPH